MFDTFTSPSYGLQLLEQVRRNNEALDPEGRGAHRSYFTAEQLKDYEALELLVSHYNGGSKMSKMLIAALEYYCREWINTKQG